MAMVDPDKISQTRYSLKQADDPHRNPIRLMYSADRTELPDNSKTRKHLRHLRFVTSSIQRISQSVFSPVRRLASGKDHPDAGLRGGWDSAAIDGHDHQARKDIDRFNVVIMPHMKNVHAVKALAQKGGAPFRLHRPGPAMGGQGPFIH
jgi:hypothetical protein